MHARQHHNHHGGQRRISRAGAAATAENPVGQRSQQESECNSEQRASEHAHRLRSQIQKVAEGKGIVLRMLLEQIGEIGSRSWWLGEREEGESDDGDDHTDPKQSCRRDESRAAFRASDGRRSLAGKPSSDQERHSRNCGDCVVLLPSGKTEEADNHKRPQKK